MLPSGRGGRGARGAHTPPGLRPYTGEIARAFLVSEPALAQRLVRAKRKIAAAGVPFEIPGRDAWPERLDAVLSTLEVAYAKAHEDAAGAGPHAGYAAEMLELTRVLAELLPEEPEALALAALVRYAEARRPARLDATWRDDPAVRAGPRAVAASADPGRRPLPQASHGSRTARAASVAGGDLWRVVREEEPSPSLRRGVACWRFTMLFSFTRRSGVRLNRAVALAEVAGAMRR